MASNVDLVCDMFGDVVGGGSDKGSLEAENVKLRAEIVTLKVEIVEFKQLIITHRDITDQQQVWLTQYKAEYTKRHAHGHSGYDSDGEEQESSEGEGMKDGAVEKDIASSSHGPLMDIDGVKSMILKNVAQRQLDGNTCVGPLKHLGLRKTPRVSTLARDFQRTCDENGVCASDFLMVAKGVKKTGKQQKIHELRGKFEFNREAKNVDTGADTILRDIGESADYVTRSMEKTPLHKLQNLQNNLQDVVLRGDFVIKASLPVLAPTYEELRKAKEKVEATLSAVESAYFLAFANEFYEGSSYKVDAFMTALSDTIDNLVEEQKTKVVQNERLQRERDMQTILQRERDLMRQQLMAELANQQSGANNMEE